MAPTKRRIWKYRTHPRKILRNNFGSAYMYKRLQNQKSLEYEARTGRLKMLESGFYDRPTWGALCKAWLAYIISCKHEDWDKRCYYAEVIQKLEGELGLEKYNFEETKELTANFLNEYRADPEIQNMLIEEIQELMRKSDTKFWNEVNG